MADAVTLARRVACKRLGCIPGDPKIGGHWDGCDELTRDITAAILAHHLTERVHAATEATGLRLLLKEWLRGADAFFGSQVKTAEPGSLYADTVSALAVTPAEEQPKPREPAVAEGIKNLPAPDGEACNCDEAKGPGSGGPHVHGVGAMEESP